MLDKVLQILSVINAIGTTVVRVEQAGRSGKAKAHAVEVQTMAMLEASEFAAGRDIVNEKKFRKGLRKTCDGIVEMLNASAWKPSA